MINIIDKLKSFKNLKDGWCYNEGIEFKESTIEICIKLINKINDNLKKIDFKIDCFPGINGEIEIVIYSLIYTISLIIENCGLFTFCLEKSDKIIEYYENIPVDTINFRNLLEKFIMKDPKDLLLSAMLPVDMLDDDDDITQSQVVGDVMIQYDFLQIIDGIGKNYFKENYLNFIDDIKKQSFSNQKILCDHIINKIQEVYNFEFPEKINIYSQSDIEDLYQFMEFLEYDNVDFLIRILEELEIDPDINLIEYKNKILDQINYYNKINIPDIFNNLIITLEPDILLRIINTMFIKNKELVLNELKIRKFQSENKEE